MDPFDPRGRGSRFADGEQESLNSDKDPPPVRAGDGAFYCEARARPRWVNLTTYNSSAPNRNRRTSGLTFLNASAASIAPPPFLPVKHWPHALRIEPMMITGIRSRSSAVNELRSPVMKEGRASPVLIVTLTALGPARHRSARPERACRQRLQRHMRCAASVPQECPR